MLTVDFDRLGAEPGDTLLDLGAGFGRHCFEAARREASVVAADLGSDELLSVASMFSEMRKADEIAGDYLAECVQANATQLCFPDETFDYVIASEVLEHIEDDSSAISELFRVTKPGGTAAVTVPARFPEKVCWRLNDNYYAPKSVGGHVRIYKKAELAKSLEAVGFEITGSHKTHALHSPYWWIKCAVGLENDSNFLVRNYLRLLTRQIMKSTPVLDAFDSLLNPVFGKSLVLYCRKNDPALKGKTDD